MIRRRCEAAVLTLLLLVLTGCAHAISGTATWPGARLEKVVLTADDFPAGVHFDRIIRPSGQPDGAGGPPAMLSDPEGCSDGLTRAIADTAERGPGSAAEYIVGYDGARIVITTGQSGNPFDRHYGDLIPAWLNGSLVPLPFSPVIPTFSPRNSPKVAPENRTRGPRRMVTSVKLSMLLADCALQLSLTGWMPPRCSTRPPMIRARPISS